LGIFLVIILGTLIDWWGYGELTFAPWNYLYQNIFLDKASGFGTLPFYGYIKFFLTNKTAPMLLVLFIGTLIGIIRYPAHPLAWGATLFFLAHSFIGHKELRFLMNILVPSIFLMVYGFSPSYFHNNTTGASLFSRIWKYRLSLPAKLLYLFNIRVLFLLFFSNGQPILMERYLYYMTPKPSEVYTLKDSPYAPFGLKTIQQDFYKPDGVQIITMDSLDTILIDAHDKDVFYVMSRDVNDAVLQLPKGLIVEKVYVSGPNLYAYLKGKIKALLHYKSNYFWTLYRIRREK
jgi:phosphatidylinositol glycan class B